MKNLLLSVFCILISGVAFGQTTYTTNFDGIDDLNYSNTGGSVLSGTAGFPTSNGSNPAYGNANSGFVGNNETATIITSAITTTNISSFSFDLASLAGTSGNGAEASDDVTVSVSIDNGLNFTDVVAIQGNSNAQWTYADGGSSVSTVYSSPSLSNSPASGGNRDDDNDGLAQVVITDIPAGDVIIKIILDNNSGNEYWAIDNMELTIPISGPTVGFSAASSTATEGTTVNIPVMMSNYSSGPVTLDIALGTVGSGNNTYENGDVTLDNIPAELTFNADGTMNVALTLNQDTDADDETLEVTISEQTATGVTISTATHTLIIKDDELPAAGDLVINEINYNPEPGSDSDFEFIEIYNASGKNLNIGNVTFTNGVTFTFTTGTTIDVGEYIIIASNSSTYSGNGYDVYDYSGSLTNTGETITIENATSVIIDEVTYDDVSPWATVANGTGVALALLTSVQNAMDNDAATSWGVSCAINGTPGAANVNCSAESEIVAIVASESTTISSLENTAGPLSATDGVQVWQFTINEGGSDLTDDDALPSIINSLEITAVFDEDDVTDWTEAIQSADLFDGTTHLATATIASSSLTFTGASLISIPDGSSKTLSLRISLGTTISQTTIDNKDFVFQITDSNIETPTDGTSSSFEFSTPQSADGQNAVEVIGTVLTFTTQPSTSVTGAAMSDVEVVTMDTNGNIDEDFATDVDITSTGTLTGSPVTATPVSGIATFSTLTHTTAGTNLTLTAAATAFTSVVSSSFDVIDGLSAGAIAFVQYNSDNSDNFAFITIVDIPANTEITFTDNGWDGSGLTSNENTGIWTATSAVTQGSLVTIEGTNATLGTMSSGLTGLAAGGDQVIAYIDNGSSETFIAAIHFGVNDWNTTNRTNNNTTGLPPGLTDQTNAVQLGDVDNGKYDGSVLTGDEATILAAINNPSNWITDNSMNQTFTVVLPVELTSFTARPTRNTVELAWTTASEENNAYFVVERSINGIDFEEIGRVEGAGTTYEAQAYIYTDVAPVNGKNYYRLRQVDFDGEFENQNIVIVNFTGESTEVAILPSTVKNQFDIVFGEATTAATELNVFSINGQLVKSEIINANSNRQTIDVANFQSGLYIIRLNVNNTIITKRFVKL